jgi:hypothetical protein
VDRLTDKQILLRTKRARRDLHAASGYDPNGGHYKAVDRYFNDVEAEMKVRVSPPLPNLGPLYAGAPNTLDFDFTHMTSGLGWPAFDIALSGDPGPSTGILAPELLTVDTKDSHATPGEAFYATGLSGIRWWFAHLDRDWPLGTKLAKGVLIGKTVVTTIGGGTHSHVACNLIPVTGKHARYGANGDGPDYTHGPYTLRTELQRR